MAMLSLTAAQADGFYFPPNWRPELGSLDKFQGSNGSLGHRASKLHLGILVVRFELPENAWCLGCGGHIARGVRFNAEKKAVGKYLSTPIHEFRMPCRMCSHPFAIRTDPENRGYAYCEGIRKKQQSFVGGEDDTVAVEPAAARDRSGKRLGEAAASGIEQLDSDSRADAAAQEANERVARLLERAGRDRCRAATLNRAARNAVRRRRPEAAGGHTMTSSEPLGRNPKRGRDAAAGSDELVARAAAFRLSRADEEEAAMPARRGTTRSAQLLLGGRSRKRTRVPAAMGGATGSVGGGHGQVLASGSLGAARPLAPAPRPGTEAPLAFAAYGSDSDG